MWQVCHVADNCWLCACDTILWIQYSNRERIDGLGIDLLIPIPLKQLSIAVPRARGPNNWNAVKQWNVYLCECLLSLIIWQASVCVSVCTYGLGTLVIAKQIHRYTKSHRHRRRRRKSQLPLTNQAQICQGTRAPRSSALSCVRMSGGGGR